MKFIKNWNEESEKQYLANLDEKINYPSEPQIELETDTEISEEIKKKAQKRKQVEQQTEKDGY